MFIIIISNYCFRFIINFPLYSLHIHPRDLPERLWNSRNHLTDVNPGRLKLAIAGRKTYLRRLRRIELPQHLVLVQSLLRLVIPFAQQRFSGTTHQFFVRLFSLALLLLDVLDQDGVPLVLGCSSFLRCGGGDLLLVEDSECFLDRLVCFVDSLVAVLAIQRVALVLAGGEDLTKLERCDMACGGGSF